MLNNHELSRKIREVKSKSGANRISNEAASVLAFIVEECTPLETKFKVLKTKFMYACVHCK